MSIVAQNKIFNGLSGKYNFHSTKNNQPAFIREGGEISGVAGKSHYLVRGETKFWFIQEERCLWESRGFFFIESSGKYDHKLSVE